METSLVTSFCGITSPNPFWLASGPPTNTLGQVERALEAGWGGVVWKTITDQPIRNVSSRYGGLRNSQRQLLGLNNIELISDRPLQDNLDEIASVKQDWPDRAMIVSLMTATDRESWQRLTRQAEDAGADGLELNFGCPHGMSERGMGSAVGQVPDYTRMVVEWVKQVARVPVIVKLTPNVADIRVSGRAAVQGGADALSLINTINSIIGVDLNTLEPRPSVGGYGSHGGYCGPAVKPIALHMVSQLATDPEIKVPLCGIGGIGSWQDAAEHIALGASAVQVCTAVMQHGFGIIEPLCSGLEHWLRQHKAAALSSLSGCSVQRIVDWGALDLNYRVVAHIDQDSCINCGACFAACEDGCHQAIAVTPTSQADFAERYPHRTFDSGRAQYLHGSGGGYVNEFRVNEDACVGCNMCAIVCPVSNCITMQQRSDASDAPVRWSQLQDPS